ncbi:MAG TPA: GTPase HflX, partial [Polyangiales bacterium]|nr:GTPase HflX [Polyangiales bacterium]
DPNDVRRLHAAVVDFFEKSMQEVEFVIPYDRQRHVQLLHERGRVLDEQYDQQGARVRVRAPEAILASLRRELEA